MHVEGDRRPIEESETRGEVDLGWWLVAGSRRCRHHAACHRGFRSSATTLELIDHTLAPQTDLGRQHERLGSRLSKRRTEPKRRFPMAGEVPAAGLAQAQCHANPARCGDLLRGSTQDDPLASARAAGFERPARAPRPEEALCEPQAGGRERAATGRRDVRRPRRHDLRRSRVRRGRRWRSARTGGRRGRCRARAVQVRDDHGVRFGARRRQESLPISRRCWCERDGDRAAIANPEGFLRAGVINYREAPELLALSCRIATALAVPGPVFTNRSVRAVERVPTT